MAWQNVSDENFQEIFDALLSTQQHSAFPTSHSEACSERMQVLSRQYAANIAEHTYIAQNIVNIGSAIIKCNQKCRSLEGNNEELDQLIMSGVPSNYPLGRSSPASEENQDTLQIEVLIDILGTRMKDMIPQLHPRNFHVAESQASHDNTASSSQEHATLLAVSLDPRLVEIPLDSVRELDVEEDASQVASSAFPSDRLAGTSAVLEHALQVLESAEQPSTFGSSVHLSVDSPEGAPEAAEDGPRRRRKNINGSEKARRRHWRRRVRDREAKAVTALAREIAAPRRE